MRVANQRGNIFTVLFGAVAIVGIITAATMQLIAGPIKTATKVNALNMANANMQAAGRILILDAANQTNSGDIDSDGTIEPRAYTTVSAGGITGGGSIPTSVGAARTDPWGTLFGYCVWNDGTSYTSLTNILAGAVVTGSPIPTVIAIVSAGPNKVFETSCVAYGSGATTGDGVSTGVVKVSGSDDIVMKWTYAEALAASGGLWSIKAGAPTTATIGKNLEITDPNNANTVTASIARDTGIGDFLGITTDLITAKTNNDLQITGKVGLGVAVPTYLLDLYDTNTATLRLKGAATGAPASAASLYLESNNDGRARGIFFTTTDGSASPWYFGVPYTGGGLQIGYNATQANYPANSIMFITSAGNVGIGNTAPVYPLDIVKTYSTPTTTLSLMRGINVVANIAGTGTGPVTNMVAGYFNADNTQSDHTVSGLRGINAIASNSGTASSLFGVVGTATNAASSTTTSMFGGNLSSTNSQTSGTVTNMYGTSVSATNNNTGSVTNMIGGYALSNNSGAGSINSLYGGQNYGYNSGSGTVGTVVGTYSYGRNSPTGTISTNQYAAYNFAYNPGNSTNVYSSYDYAWSDSASTNTNLYGTYAYGYNAGASTNSYGGYIQGLNSGTVSGILYGLYNYGYNATPGTTPTMYGLYNYSYNTGTATTQFGIYDMVYNIGPANTSLYGMHIQARTQHSSGTLGQLTGARIIAQSLSSNNVSAANAVIGQVDNNTASTMTNAVGIQGLISTANAGSIITTGTALNADLQLGSGSVGTYYGLKIEDEGTATSTYYSIYTGNASGTGTKSFFGGKVGVGSGKTAPAYDIDAAGDIRANSFIMSSDIRLKKNVATLDNALELVTKLRGVHFNWKQPVNDDQKGLQTGVIAQEVEKVFPELVTTDNKGYKAVNYPALIAPLIEAVKELKHMLEDILAKLNPLTERVTKLEMENKALYKHIDGLEKRVQALESAAVKSK